MSVTSTSRGTFPSHQLSDNRTRETRMAMDALIPLLCSDDQQDRSQVCFGTKLIAGGPSCYLRPVSDDAKGHQRPFGAFEPRLATSRLS